MPLKFLCIRGQSVGTDRKANAGYSSQVLKYLTLRLHGTEQIGNRTKFTWFALQFTRGN